MKIAATPKPYIPRPWQLPHLLATPVGATWGDWAWFYTAERVKRA